MLVFSGKKIPLGYLCLLPIASHLEALVVPLLVIEKWQFKNYVISSVFINRNSLIRNNLVTLKYSWPLNNVGLNCKGPFIPRYFPIVNTAVLHGQVHGWLNPQMQKNCRYAGPTVNYMQINHPVLFKGQHEYSLFIRSRMNAWFLYF